MNTRIRLMGGLLAVQLLAVAALLLSSGMGTDRAAAGLLPFEPAAATRLGIAAEDEEVVLTRGDDGWQLGDGLPADDGKVGEVLEKLAEASAAWPVATSAATAERFEVTADSHQRRLSIDSQDGDSVTLYLGSSPGYRRVHARVDGDDEVYSIDFSNYQAPTDAGQWLDKQLLRPQGDVERVGRANEWALERGGDAGDWLLDGEPADQEAADKLVGRFADLSVLGIADSELGIADDGAEPRGSFEVRDEAGDYRLDFFFNEEEDDYSVTSSRLAGRYEVATYIAEQMLIEADDLLPEAVTSEADEDAASEDAAVDTDSGDDVGSSGPAS